MLALFANAADLHADEASQMKDRIKFLEEKLKNTHKLEDEIDILKHRLNKIESNSGSASGISVDKQFPANNRSKTPQNFPGAPNSETGSIQSVLNQFPAYNRTPVSPSFQRSTASGFSRLYNPALSVNGMYLGTYSSENNSNRTAETRTGFKVQEIEIQATASVDNYLRSNLVATFEDGAFEIEESYVDAVITRNFSIRAGKWFSNFGKHNFLHQHQFPFIDAPLVNANIFGEEALNEVGVGVNYLVPVPWYSELIFDVLEGDNTVLFNGSSNNQFAYLFHAKNLWDLNEDTTLEVDGSYVYGKNGAGTSNNASYAVGGSVTLKWIPAQLARYQQIEWQTEYIQSEREAGVVVASGAPNPDQQRSGMYTYLKYQFAQNWWAQGRYDYYGFERVLGENRQYRFSGLLGYVPSEFSAIRLQYNYLDQKVSDEHQVLLQLNYTMGSHPAHNY